jgi:hypothetical protein
MSDSSQHVVAQPADDSARIAQLPQIRRLVEDPELPAFNWPLEKASSGGTPTAIVADLLD